MRTDSVDEDASDAAPTCSTAGADTAAAAAEPPKYIKGHLKAKLALVKHAACSDSDLRLYLHSLCERHLYVSLSLALRVCLMALIPFHVRAGRPLSFTLSPDRRVLSR